MEAQKMATNAETKPAAKLIHAARIQPHGSVHYLLLRKTDPHTYVWYEQINGQEVQTPISAAHVAEAVRLAYQHWKNDSFRTVNCGFRYTLPERDEHGCNALFHQMAASYSSMNGVYFDEDLGHNCTVHFASSEGRDLWQALKKDGRL